MPIRGKRQENIDDFKVLLKQIKGLQKALKKAGEPALFLLLSGESNIRSDKVPPSELQQRVERRRRQVVGTLAYMHARCNWLIAQRPGEEGHADFRQRRVAHEAWRLLRRHGKIPAGGTWESFYGNLASLLYEAMTGDGDKNLQWACKAALRLADEGDLRDDGPIVGRGQISVP